VKEVVSMVTPSINVAEAKRRFSDLLGRVAYGKEQITITRRGRPMVTLVPPDLVSHRPHLAEVKGWLSNDDPFFDTMDRIVESRLTHRPRPPRV
jgi:prevent-host-death family protein